MCSENKGADQLRGYREADLHLCFRICKKPFYSRRGSYNPLVFTSEVSIFQIALLLQSVMSDLVGNPKERFFSETTQFTDNVISGV